MAKNIPGIRIENLESAQADPFARFPEARAILDEIVDKYGINRADDHMYEVLTREAKNRGYDLLTAADRFNDDIEQPAPYWMSNKEYDSYLEMVQDALNGDADASAWLNGIQQRMQRF